MKLSSIKSIYISFYPAEMTNKSIDTTLSEVIALLCQTDTACQSLETIMAYFGCFEGFKRCCISVW